MKNLFEEYMKSPQAKKILQEWTNEDQIVWKDEAIEWEAIFIPKNIVAWMKSKVNGVIYLGHNK